MSTNEPNTQSATPAGSAGAAAALAVAAARLVNGSCPLPGVATAGQPAAADFQRLADAGYRVILDLRPPSEPRGFDEAAAVRSAGLRYEVVPVTAQTLSDADFDRVREILRDPANRPLVIHCASANRVGALLIPYLMLDEGRSQKEALALAQQAGLRSPNLADAALRYVSTAQ